MSLVCIVQPGCSNYATCIYDILYDFAYISVCEIVRDTENAMKMSN